MKILMLSKSDGRGGGYAAAFRLLQGLEKLNVSVQMLVGESTRGNHSVIGPQNNIQKLFNKMSPYLDSIPLKLYPNRKRVIFSPAILPDRLTKKVITLKPDLIHLQWVAGGFLRLETLKRFNKPLVWTLHDMWPFTGGCHYNEECGRYREKCGKCSLLGSSKNWDLSRWILKRKLKTWKGLNLTIVTPSRWLANCAKKSSLFSKKRIEVIPNGLDLYRFKPIDKQFAREVLCLPQDKKIILFGAMNSASDKRKGFNLLLPTLEILAQNGWRDKVELVIFGATESTDSTKFGLRAHYMDYINDDISLSLLYSAADIFVAPSIQDNLPNTIMESLACGTSVIAFDIGGISDMVVHKKTGYLARPFDTNDLAKGIEWVLEDNERWQILSRQSRIKVEREFGLEVISKRYANLYREILK